MVYVNIYTETRGKFIIPTVLPVGHKNVLTTSV